MTTKEELRRQMRNRLQAMPASERATASATICEQIVHDPAITSATCIAVFDSLPAEPDMAPLVSALRARTKGTTICYPRCEDENIRFYSVATERDLVPVRNRRFREPDPDSCPAISPADIDLVLVPGLAFSSLSHHRLGRGGGFYDRFLALPDLRAVCLGVCFPCQIHDPLPAEPHDRPVDRIITPPPSF